jgi:hypothetical protein
MCTQVQQINSKYRNDKIDLLEKNPVSAKGLSILIGGQFLAWTSSAVNPEAEDIYFLGCSESKTEYCSLFRQDTIKPNNTILCKKRSKLCLMAHF